MAARSVAAGIAPAGQEPGAGGSIARNATYLVLGQAATTVFAVLLSAALGRSLGATDFGLLFLVTSMAQFAFVVVEWGQLQYVVREVARDRSKAGQLLGGALAVRIAGTVLLAGATVLIARTFGYDGRTRLLVALLMAAMLPFLLAQAFALVFRGVERMEYEALVSVLNKAGMLALTLTALGLGFGLLGVIAAQGLAGVVSLVAAVLLLRRLQVPEPRATWEGAKLVLAGGTSLVAMNIATSLQSYLDAVVLSKLGSAESIGWYGAARMILGTLIAPATILASSAYPRLSRAAQDLPRFREEMQIAIRPVLGFAVLAGVGTWLFARPAVELIYGRVGFDPAATILRVFSVGLVLLFVDILLGNALVASGRPLPLAIGKVVNILLTTLLAVLLVPWSQEVHGNGGLGIALAFGIGEFIMFFTVAFFLPRGTLRLTSLVDLGRALLAGGGTLALFLLLPPLHVLVGAPLAVCVFGALAALVGLVRKDELAKVAAQARKRWGAKS